MEHLDLLLVPLVVAKQAKLLGQKVLHHDAFTQSQVLAIGGVDVQDGVDTKRRVFLGWPVLAVRRGTKKRTMRRYFNANGRVARKER